LASQELLEYRYRFLFAARELLGQLNILIEETLNRKQKSKEQNEGLFGFDGASFLTPLKPRQ
jgi:hypothetical protein